VLTAEARETFAWASVPECPLTVRSRRSYRCPPGTGLSAAHLVGQPTSGRKVIEAEDL
jgi:hypothetical protein